MENYNNINVENSANASAEARASAGGGAGGSNMRVMVAGGGGALIGLAILLIVLRVLLGAALFMSVLSGGAIVAAVALVIGLAIWYFQWSRKNHERELLRWIQTGANIGVSVQTASLAADGQRYLAVGKVTSEALKALRATGALEHNNQPPLFLPGALSAPEQGNTVEGDFNVIHGLDEEQWQ